MKLDHLDLIVRDVPAAAAFFRDVVGLELSVSYETYAELKAGAVTLMLSPSALVPTQPARGVILHLQVEDVRTALEHARNKGAIVLLEPTVTDWGTEAAMIAGPEESIVEFYCNIEG